MICDAYLSIHADASDGQNEYLGRLNKDDSIDTDEDTRHGHPGRVSIYARTAVKVLRHGALVRLGMGGPGG